MNIGIYGAVVLEKIFFKKRQILYILVKISFLRMSKQFDFIYDGFYQVLINLT